MQVAGWSRLLLSLTCLAGVCLLLSHNSCCSWLLLAQTRNTARAQKRCNTLLWRELCANISAAVGSLRAASHRSSLTAPPLFRPAWVRPNQPELLVPGCTWWYFWWYLLWYLCVYFCHWSSPPQTCQGAPQPEMLLAGTFFLVLGCTCDPLVVGYFSACLAFLMASIIFATCLGWGECFNQPTNQSTRQAGAGAEIAGQVWPICSAN